MITIPGSDIDAALEKAPPEVQEAVLDARVSVAASVSGKANGLHVDHIGIASKLGVYMLLGFVSPTQFVAELKAAGVEEGAAEKVVQDLNTQVFAPILETIKEKDKELVLPTVGKVSEEKPVPTSAAPKTPAPTLPAPTKPAAPVVPEAKPTLPVEPIKKVPTLPPLPPRPVSMPVTPAATPPVPAPLATPPPKPPLRTMATDVKDIQKAPPVLTPRPTSSLSSLRPLSGTPTPPAPVIPPKPPVPPPPTPAAPTEKEVVDTLKSYGVDPYRESIE